MATLRITRLLKKAWEDYLHTNTCQQSERCEKLDIFLAKFLWLYKENKFETCPRFSDLISIGNILTRQFLTDINYVCSQCSDKDDDAAPLVNYLLEGRGWKILWLIEFIGVQGLACNKELANLLLSLFPLCSQFPISRNKNESSQTRERTLIDIEACFKKFINTSSNSAKISLDSKKPSSGEMHRSSRHQSKRASKNRNLSQSFRITRVETTDTEYIAEMDASSLKEQLVQIQLNPFDFSYFTMSGVRSSEDEKGFEDTNEVSQEEMENIQSLIQQPLNSLEFCESVISLLQKICQGDQTPQNTLSIPVSATILPFAVNMLLTVHQGRGYTENWNFKDSHHTKQQLLHLVFTAAAALAPHPDGVFFVEQARVIPSLVAVVQEIQNLLHVHDSEASEQTSKENLLLLAFNIMYGCLMLICIIVEKAIPTQDYTGIIQLFRLFSVNDGYALCSQVFSDYELLVQNEEKQLLQHRITELIQTMSRIINYMKSVRQLHFHNQICKKRRHRWCNLNIYGNHHHNLFGIGCTQSIFNKSPVCCISSAIILLLQIYSSSQVVQTQLTILGFLTKVGFCCCLNVVNVLKYLLDCLPRQTAVMRQIALSFIETTVLEQLGGTDSTNERLIFCVTCKTNDATFLTSLLNLNSLLMNKSINVEEKILQVSGHMTSVWSAVEKYSNFLISNDIVLIHQVERHLLHLCSAGNRNVNCELLLQIFLPRFFNIVSTFSNKSMISEHVLACCLSAFCIVCKYQIIADIFLDIGGLQLLQRQLQYISLRPLVLRVLHVLIIAEITKLMESQKKLSSTSGGDSSEMVSQLHSTKLNNVQSVVVFQEILLQYNANYLRNILKLTKVIKDSSSEDISNQPSVYLNQQLSYMADLWSTCAVLIHQSNPYKLYCEINLVIGQAYELMLELLQFFIKLHDTSSDSAELEMLITRRSIKSLLNLLDSLLIICLEVAPFATHSDGTVIEKHNIIEILRSKLKNLILWPPTDVRSLLETLIHAAIGQPFGNWQKSEYLYLEEFLPLCEEVEDVELELSEVSTGVENIMADEGYEADIELLDNSKGKLLQELEASLDDATVMNACGSETSLEHALTFPDLCSLVLELLVQFAKKSLPNKEQEYEYFMALTSVINRLVSLCRDCIQNCMILYHQGILKIILEGFHDSMSDNCEYSELKLSLLDLFVLVAQCAITAEELCLYLALFKTKNPPLNYLLIFFNTLVDKVVQQPTYMMYFPATMPQNYRDPKLIPYFPPAALKTNILYTMKTSRSSSVNTVTGKSADIKQRIPVQEDIAKQFCIQHNEQNIASSFSLCALEIPLQSAHFTTFQKGFSIAAWLRVCRFHYTGQTKFHGAYNLKHKTGFDDSWQHDDNSTDMFDDVHKIKEQIGGQTRENLHLFSVGNGNLIYELWCDPVTEAIVIRITEVLPDVYEIKAEKSVKSVLKMGYWHHVTVNYETKSGPDKMTLEVRIIINGCIDQNIQLEFKVSVINDNNPFMLLGHNCRENQLETLRDSWYLGNLFLFKDVVFTPESSLYMYALGPDCCSFAECLAESESLSFAPGIIRKLLHANVDISLLTAAQLTSLKPLQDSLVLLFSPQNPSLITCYPLIKSSTPIFGNALTGLLPRPADLRFNAEEIRLQNNQAPFTLEINNFGEMTTLMYQGLDSAIANLGGIPIFVFLVARVMEISNNEEVQAEAVRLVLSLAGRNSRFRMAFLSLGGPSLLTKLLSSSQCKISFRLLKEILNACLNVPVMECEKDGQKPKLKDDTEALIIDPELLSEIISAWKVWEKDDIIIEHTFLISLQILIREDHPYRNFNIQQLSSICLLDLLLSINKERFIHEDSKVLPENMCEVMIYLIRCMLGDPPNINLLPSICDFLLLSHSAVNTYVCHSQSSFYYLLATEYNSDYSSATGEFHSNVVSGISKNASGQHNDLIIMVNEQSQYDNSAQFIDSSKLTKALVNLQIKQNSGNSKDAIISSDSDFVVEESYNEQYKKEELRIEGTNNLASVEETEHSLNKDTAQKKEASVTQSDDTIQLTDYQKEEIDEKITEDSSAALSQNLQEKRESDNTAFGFDSFQSHQEKESELQSQLEQIEPIFSESDTEKIDQEKKMLNLDDAVINSQQLSTNEFSPGEGQKSESSQNQTDGDWEIFSLGKLPRNSELFDTDEQDSLSDFNLGLLNILCEVIKSLSTEMQHSVLGSMIKPEALIVFAHNKSSQIRAAIVRLIGQYLSAASDVQINAFLKIKGFHLLANQLFQYPTTIEIAEACLSMVTQCEFACEDMYNLSVLKDPSFIQQSSAVVLLAIIPNSFHDIVACHNILHVLQEICEETSEFFQTLINQGLIEAVLKLVQNVNHCPSRFTDVISDRNEDLIYTDVKVFLAYVSTSAVSSRGRIPFSSFTDLLLLLSYIERKELNEGSDMNIIKAVRDIQCSCLQAALESVYHTNYETSKASKSSKKSENAVMREGFFVLSPVDAGIPGCLQPPDQQQKMEYGAESVDSYVESLASAKFIDNVASRKAIQQASLSDMHDRLKQILHRSVDFLVHSDYVDVSEYEKVFVRFLTQLMVQGAVDILHINGRNKSKQTPWRRMVWANRSSLRLLLCRLLVFLLTPFQLLDQQLFAVNVILKEEKRKEIILTVLNSNSQLEKKFSLYLHELVYEKSSVLTEQDKEACHLLISLLNLCGIPTLPPPSAPGKNWSLILEEKKNWPEEMKLKKSLWIRQNESLEHKVLSKFDALTKIVSETAMAITRTTVESQNISRKAFIEYIKSLYSHKLQVRQTWQQLILQLTHERAVWHFPESYPQSWQLDPTEGPNRERKRLQRCHLQLKAQYFQLEYRKKLESAFCNPPLAFLYEDESQTLDSAALVDRLHTNEKIRFTCPGTIITPSSETPGEILIGSHCVYFVGEETKLDFCSGQDNMKDIISLTWSFEEVTEILKRRFELQDNALELFLTNGKTYLIAFSTTEERNDMFRHLIHSNLPNLVETSDLGSLTQLWQDGILTNLEYLTQLNKLAGRSFNDLMQYPVFPFVLSEYSASSLNLLDPHSYRNFSRPMSIQDKNKEQHYVKTFSYLKAEQKQGTNEHLMPAMGPYHYGSHYSNSGIVLHFLVRLPPFTGMFLKYQDSSFDIPDRTFHSIQTSWRLSSSDSNTDMKELVPEFFFLPEFLVNREGFDFGVRQTGERVHDVILPPWSRNNPRLFILIHRQALESDFVTENINEWIDLIFGYKQTGKAAVDAINIFHPATYYGFDINSITDPIRRAAVQTMIKTFGQTPRQLFKKPHPMVALSLVGGQSRSIPVRIKPVLPEIKGLKWGNYVGSPAEEAPVLVWRHTHQPPIGKFISLLTNDVFGLASNCCLIISYCKEKGSSLVNITYVTAAALVSWGHTDSVVRLKLCKDQPPIQFIKSDIFDPICCCSSIPDCCHLFMGHTSGRIDVYNVNFYPAKPKVEVKEKAVQLFGHTAPITQIHICKNYSIVVSASKDKTCIIWDLTRLDFVQSIASHSSPVNLVTVSDTTGDIASVSDADGGSILHLHTINAASIGKMTTDIGISSVCFSNAPEGISVNVVGTGMVDGTIRLWSTWDLSFISIISADKFSEPIICVTYSADSQHLYAANSEGIVVIWERPSKGSAKTPKFHTVV